MDKQSERASCEPSSGEVQPPAQASAEKTQMQAPERRQLRAVKRINYKTYGDTGEKVPLDEAHIALALTEPSTHLKLQLHGLLGHTAAR